MLPYQEVSCVHICSIMNVCIQLNKFSSMKSGMIPFTPSSLIQGIIAQYIPRPNCGPNYNLNDVFNPWENKVYDLANWAAPVTSTVGDMILPCTPELLTCLLSIGNDWLTSCASIVLWSEYCIALNRRPHQHWESTSTRSIDKTELTRVVCSCSMNT